jgi:glycine betaine/proline transport system substrate-binding protein
MTSRRFGWTVAVSLAVLAPLGIAHAADPASCASVRMAEPGWNDLALTTGTASVLLNALGYKPASSVLAIEVLYAGLKRGDLDVFLGYWDPAMVHYYKPYQDDGSVETVHRNLTGAKYTFAVPTYVYDAGVHDIADLSKFTDKFEKKMYGIEPGSNELALNIVKDPSFHLDGWTVVESSEQGMLAEVERKTHRHEWIVFQGWAPHPMNDKFQMSYLTGGDKYYGPDFGAATVSTQVRKGYMDACPNVATLLRNLTFDIPYENRGMGHLIDEGMSPVDAAAKAIKEQPNHLDGWLKGVTTIDGKDGLAAVKAKLGL